MLSGKLVWPPPQICNSRRAGKWWNNSLMLWQESPCIKSSLMARLREQGRLLWSTSSNEDITWSLYTYHALTKCWWAWFQPQPRTIFYLQIAFITVLWRPIADM
jgi:hypothetical protein